MDTTSCNRGDQAANWDQLPGVDHPIMSINMFRLQTVDGSDRFEQIGRSWIKHGFGSSNDDECGFGCACNTQPEGCRFDKVEVACSDTYASFQWEPCGLGSPGLLAARSVINPWTAEFAELVLKEAKNLRYLSYSSLREEALAGRFR